ncbi:MAG: bifunctional phosphoribosyl-AMP cyclohydrolase/phosphoribosyl-ATP diphosphatase HisIE [Chloroflexi bacterium]|nr:bifunctional phosphoribosyl-AMP cyclohydrolase/phosphoribosyl-ATP diphosphatase HisIE [Chloroflexota bacterium]
MIQFNDRGLIPAIVQDAESGRVLMHAYMNEEALRRTLEGPDAWFYSRSRQELWHKGETSGNYMKVVEVERDCDSDAVLVAVVPVGPACHTGTESCFDSGILGPGSLDAGDTPRSVDAEDTPEKPGPGILADLLEVIRQRAEEKPEGSYTAELLEAGTGRVAQKVVEEAGEVAIASVSQTGEDLANEMADLLYHSMVLLASAGVPADRVWEVLAERRR